MIRNLKKNLLAGLRLAPSNAFSAGFDQAAALLLVCVAVIVIFGYPYGADRAIVDWIGIASWAAVVCALGALVLIVGRIHDEPVTAFATQLLATAPWFLALVLLVARLMPDVFWAHKLLMILGAGIVMAVAFRSFRGTAAVAVLFLLAIAVVVINVDWYRFAPPAVFYGIDDSEQDRYRDIDIERTYHDQTRLVDTALESLQSQRPGFSDIYFLGFAGNNDEPVFRRDLSWVHEFIDGRFGTSGRSLSLHATLETAASEALASRYNLRRTLAGIGEIIDPNEDSVFLYLTSHGAEAGWLDVSLYPLPSQQLTAQDLKQALDDAGIRWRIIVISACFSGSFIDELANEQTLIMTAASADKSSFGCELDSDMTWFTEALFKEGLASGMGLVDAFDHARQSIADRENESGFESSDPQIFIGEAMRKRLEAIDRAVDLIDSAHSMH